MNVKPSALHASSERRTVTIVAATLDVAPHLSVRRVEQAKTRLRTALRAASGRIVTFPGEIVMAAFASPTDALQCALRLQGAGGRGLEAEPIRVRIGVNAGTVLANGGHVGGPAIALAASLARAAPQGGIALPAALHDRIGDDMDVPGTAIGHPVEDDPVLVVTISARDCQGWTGGTTGRRRPVAEPRITLAVVPFRGPGDAGTLADHAADDVIHVLGGLTTWIAVTRTKLDQIRAPIDLQRLGHNFAARYVLHGAVERQRGMLRISAELNEAETGRVLWSDRFERSAEHEAALRDEAAPRIASAIAPLLAQRELDRIALQPDHALTAQDTALRAYAAVVQPERAEFQTAGDWLRQALERPGPHAAVHFATVAWHLMNVGQGWSRDPAWDARAAATAAEGLDRNDPSALAILGYLHSLLHRDHALSLTLLDRVIDRAPHCGLAWMLKASVLSQVGAGEDAIFAAERAEAMPVLGPERAWRCQSAAMACYVGGRYADAVRWARVGAMHYPGLAINERVMAASLAVLGRLDEAQQASDRLLRIDPGFRVGEWRRRSLFTAECRERYSARLRLAGLPE